MISAATPHTFHYAFGLAGVDAALLGDDVTELVVDFSGHVGRVAAHVEVGLLFQEVVDQFALFLHQVLHVDFVFLFAREGVEDDQIVAQSGFEILEFQSGFELFLAWGVGVWEGQWCGFSRQRGESGCRDSMTYLPFLAV